MAWYHCGRCGSLFKSPTEDANDRRCATCGQDPSLGVEAVPASPAHPAGLPSRSHSSQGREKRSERRSRRSFLMAKILGGWVLTTTLIALAILWIWPEDSGRYSANSSDESSVKGTAGDESVVILNKALAACCEVLGGFFNAGAPEERNQFVLNPVATAGRMARFYDLNPLTRIDPSSVSNTDNTLLDLPTGQALESRWTSTDGRTLDCVFVQQNGEWRLDWEHFARYSEYPWSLFLSGAGDPEAEFRLLVRERLLKERSETNYMSLAFYAPRFGFPDQAGSPSPEFLVRRDSPDGELLAAAFDKQAKGEALFGSKLASLDPHGMIRVRVKIRRLAVEAASGQKFELVKVLACHWLSLADAGVKPAASAPQQDPPTPASPPAGRPAGTSVERPTLPDD